MYADFGWMIRPRSYGARTADSTVGMVLADSTVGMPSIG